MFDKQLVLPTVWIELFSQLERIDPSWPGHGFTPRIPTPIPLGVPDEWPFARATALALRRLVEYLLLAREEGCAGHFYFLSGSSAALLAAAVLRAHDRFENEISLENTHGKSPERFRALVDASCRSIHVATSKLAVVAFSALYPAKSKDTLVRHLIKDKRIPTFLCTTRSRNINCHEGFFTLRIRAFIWILLLSPHTSRLSISFLARIMKIFIRKSCASK